MSSPQNSFGDSILYELLVYSEWIQEPEILLKLMKPENKLLRLATRPWTLKYLLPYSRRETVTDKIGRLVSARLPWQFAVGEDGKVVAIIQDTMLEIRTSRDEYSSVVGRASISRDHFPQYRRAVWSPDCSLLACAFSSGRIGLYDLLGSNILNIEPKTQQPEEWPNTDEAIAGIFFLEDRVKSPKSYELIAVDFRGNLRSFLVSPTEGFREHHTYSFSSYYRNGISALQLIQPGNLLSDVVTLKVSPAGRLLACMHACGAVSLWQLPSLRLFKYWQLSEQPDHNARNPQLVEGHSTKLSANSPNSSKETTLDFLPVDISWWSENVLIIARYSGAVSVCSTTDLHNLLGEYPEFFAGPPQVSAASCDGRGFLSLECEVNVSSKQPSLGDSMDQSDEASSADEAEPEDSIIRKSTSAMRSVLYWVTDNERFRPPRPKPRIRKRTYRLLGLKSTTPEELYSRKINNEEYGEALQLARTYGLDCDLVYQRQWRNHQVSVTTIEDYLSKIKKRAWVLQECTDRVPETAAAARGLLLFGLNATCLQVLLDANPVTRDLLPEELEGDDKAAEADVLEIVSQLRDIQLNSEQKQILECRCKLLRYLDMLNTYERILGGGSSSNDELYNASFYSKFRSQSLLHSAVDFARDVINSYSAMSRDRSLLPECEDDTVVPWPLEDLREQDWSEELCDSEELGDEVAYSFLYKEEQWLLEYCSETLSAEQLSEWYLARATQLEASSKLVDHALSLIVLGQQRSVQGLDSLLAELLTLEVLVYEVQMEGLSLSTLRQHNHLSQMHLLMSKIFKESKKEPMRPFFSSMEETITVALDCLYTYPETDELHLAFEFLECLPEKGHG
ncbi:hypothetical protein B566_EDAN009755 [Ephemera danica]|nr:hypothetical protein B566_EDAN009755 [Ephemera danica]